MRRNAWIAGATAVVVIGVVFILRGSKDKDPGFRGTSQLLNDNGVLFAVGDNEPYSGRITDYYPNGVKKYEVDLVNGVAQGMATEWHINGQKMTETTLKDGVPVGTITGWYRMGAKEYELPVEDGDIHGMTTEYYESCLLYTSPSPRD